MAETKTKKIKSQPLGGSGTTVYSGIVSNAEYLPNLNTEYGFSGLDIYNRMRSSDSVVGAALDIVKLGILQAEWYVEKAPDEVKGQEIADFIQKALFEMMDRDFAEILKDVLTYLDFGFFVGEKVFWTDGKNIWLKDIELRDARSIERFQTKDKQDGVTQILQGDEAEEKGSSISIPMWKLAVFTHKKEGKNWRGKSILRTAYKPWYFKENVEKIDAIGFEREAVGIPIFKMPQSPTPEDSEKADELGQNLRSNEKAYIKLPFGWDFDVKFPQGSSRGDADVAIRRFDRQIFYAVLAQFMDLGSGNTGSRALSNDQSSAFYKSLQAVAEYIASIVNATIIPQLIDLNFVDVVKYPKLKVTGIEKIDPDIFSTALQRLVVSGLLLPDDELEKFIRKQFRLPEKSATSPTIEELAKEKREMFLESGYDMKNQNNKEKDGNATDKKNKDLNKKDDTNKDENTLKKKFSESSFWRPKTFAEQKVNLNKLRLQMSKIEMEVMDLMIKSSMVGLDYMMANARAALESGDVSKAEFIISQLQIEISTIIEKKFVDSFEMGKIGAADEIGVNAPSTSPLVRAEIASQARMMAEKFNDDLASFIKINTAESIKNGKPIQQALSFIRTSAEEQAKNAASIISNIVSVGGINEGRGYVFDANADDIYAWQRSEILDDRVCNFCVSVDGRTVRTDDPIRKKTIFHFKCRGIWVAIMNDEVEKPEITGIPDTLKRSAGVTIDDFQQIKSPIPLAGSLAEDYIKSESELGLS